MDIVGNIEVMGIQKAYINHLMLSILREIRLDYSHYLTDESSQCCCDLEAYYTEHEHDEEVVDIPICIGINNKIIVECTMTFESILNTAVERLYEHQRPELARCVKVLLAMGLNITR